jgi:hypothetical protein
MFRSYIYDLRFQRWFSGLLPFRHSSSSTVTTQRNIDFAVSSTLHLNPLPLYFVSLLPYSNLSFNFYSIPTYQFPIFVPLFSSPSPSIPFLPYSSSSSSSFPFPHSFPSFIFLSFSSLPLLLQPHPCFRRFHCQHSACLAYSSTIVMAAVRSSEMSAKLYPTTWRRIRKTTLLIFTALKT